MNWKWKMVLLLITGMVMKSCGSVKVLDAWKGEQENIEKFKEKNVLVIARTADDHARIAFEENIANALKARGIKATESFKKAPKIYPNREITEERVALIKSLMASEGFNGVVLTVIKDKQQTQRTSSSGIYVGATYSGYYPGYYGTFYDYYAYPYAFGPYYDSFGGYVPMSTTTKTYTTYILETVAYNLDEPSENQLVAVVTSSIDDPKEAYKTAEKYVDQMMKSLE
ncbi:hypothetical protein ACT6NV_03230 [Robiginitalea sp. IMCC44478]|uniref:hypothetical protein n=1 Tax=Robiginitalea sp. IMCC44478 TaxID=3459122 RepID=UPI004041EE9E